MLPFQTAPHSGSLSICCVSVYGLAYILLLYSNSVHGLIVKPLMSVSLLVGKSVQHFGPEKVIQKTNAGQIVMKFDTNIYCALKMILADFSDILTFSSHTTC